MQTQTNEIEEQLALAKQAVTRAEALERLKKNKDFKTLILQDFMVDSCANFARQSANFSMPKESREDALAIAQAAGHLDSWMSVLLRQGQIALAQIEEIEEAIVASRQESGDQ